MYFASRIQAGRMLASQIIERYGGQECALIALSDGGVVVGAQIAQALGAVINLMLADEISLPREIEAVAGITQDGAFSYNQSFSQGEIDEMVGEYRGLIEQEKLEKLHAMHRSVGDGVIIREDLVQDRNVILVSDGLKSGFSLDLAIEYLKPVPVRKLIVATPFASVPAVDRMHILVDDIFCLNVLEDYISTDHYYDNNDMPDHSQVITAVKKILENWKAPQLKKI
jgi:putative phosphoribosyl transferase